MHAAPSLPAGMVGVPTALFPLSYAHFDDDKPEAWMQMSVYCWQSRCKNPNATLFWLHWIWAPTHTMNLSQEIFSLFFLVSFLFQSFYLEYLISSGGPSLNIFSFNKISGWLTAQSPMESDFWSFCWLNKMMCSVAVIVVIDYTNKAVIWEKPTTVMEKLQTTSFKMPFQNTMDDIKSYTLTFLNRKTQKIV